MKVRFLLAALAAAALPTAAPAQAAQAQRDWSTVVAATPEGGFRMGNPDAPVKLVEFVSLTCGHCAHFAEEGLPPLIAEYVKSGRVSFEYRNFYLNAIDLVAAAVSRCAAPDDYFALTDELLASQQEWIGPIQALSQEQRKELAELGPEAGLGRVAGISGLDKIAARHGLGADELKACLADTGNAQKLIEMRKTASEQLGVSGTPSFLVNGRLADHVHDWAALEPLLKPTT